MNKEIFYKELYNRYGPVTRARNCFLYTKKGVRLTDMNQENGRAILGWDAGNAFTHLKNTINRGLTGCFITEDHCRLDKAVSQLFQSERKAYIFSTKSDALKYAISLSPESTSVYRPWNISQADLKETSSILFEPPLPWTDTVYILAVKKELAGESVLPPKSITLPFALKTGITRAIYNLTAELPLREEKHWFIYDQILCEFWERKGPYLFPKIPENQYDDFILKCLDAGIVINPDYNSPSIIPFGADKGVFTKLKETK